MKKVYSILISLLLISCVASKVVFEFDYYDYACKVEIINLVKVEENLIYQERKALNEDYIGNLKIGNIIDEIVVQSDDNEYYLSHNFNKEYSSSGTVFMDYRNTLNDQNIIFYGHYVYRDESLIFSPLHLLKDINNYENNKYITLELEDTVRTYIITDVFYFTVSKMTPAYYYTEYDDFDAYYEEVKSLVFYDSNEGISGADNWITLQTCVRNRNDLRLIVLAKEIKRG